MSSPIVNAHCVFDYALFGDAVCPMGVFDGVHQGHKFVIGEALKEAKEQGKRCVIITFSVDPDELFHPDRLHKLQTNNERLLALAELGADSVAVLPFDAEFAAQNPMQFLQRIFRKFPPYSIHVGSDFRFGAKAEGTVDTLREWSKLSGTKIEAHNLFEIDGAPVTSTRIRLLLEDEKPEEAKKLL